MTRLVVIVVLGAERADRDQPVGAGIRKLHKQAGAGDAGNPPLKRRADAVGEEMRDQPIGRLAFRFHGAAFGHRNLRRDFAERLQRLGFRQRAFAEAERADQRAMHDQVSVSPDRRCEMRVTAKVEAEMAVILRRIFRLRLRAQHHFVDQRLVVLALHQRQHAVERRRPEYAGLGKGTWPSTRLNKAGRSAPVFANGRSSVFRNSWRL